MATRYVVYCMFGEDWDQSSTVDLAAADGVVIYKNSTNHAPILTSGFFNNDDIVDLVISESAQNRVSILYGAVSFPDTFDLEKNPLTDPVGIHFNFGPDRAGSALAVGDVNNDGIDDLAIGAPQYREDNRGRVYVLFGRIDDELAGFYMNGTKAGGQLGYALCMDGDVNGDGVVDLIVGEFLADSVFVIYGGGGNVSTGEMTVEIDVEAGDLIEIFVYDPSGGEWEYEAVTKDGNPLPFFLTFENLTLTGIVPPDQTTDIFVVVTGKDDEGNTQIQYDYSFLFGVEDGDGEEEGDGDSFSPIIWIIPVLLFVCFVIVCITIVLGAIVGIFQRRRMQNRLRGIAGSQSL
eukprot:TRINITY_DN4463_c0_g1_i5.p1 TRINITY_DN4463_c0_g1~~TRINITY_DN4463_c0_g1_i5.p1  ORF type:complete len:375 (-),score=74.08 TRINITY_DN4463_c0_g1_i5:2-1045(-)